MHFIAKTQRRFKRSLRLGGRWLLYMYQQPDTLQALHDFCAWLKITFSKSKDPFRYELPWLSLPMVRWLRAHLHSRMEVFEWGSGNSTLFLSSHTQHVVSVEHDPDWYELVQNKLQKREISNVQLLFAPLSNKNGSSANSFSALSSPSSPISPERYVESILNYPDGYFDMVIVDGKKRVDCLQVARSKVKPGGSIVLDNSERSEYALGLALFNEPEWTTYHIEGPVPNTIWPVFGRATVFTKVPEQVIHNHS